MNANLSCQVEAALSRVRDGVSASDIEHAVRFPLPTGLVPQELWALVSFLRHERRQKWVGHIVESRLSAQGNNLARMGAFAHPEEIPQRGQVPGEDGWTYFFHGRGCCFTHHDGTVIDVDFADDGSALEIDRYFYSSFLASAPRLGWCEQQLMHPGGLEDAWHFDLANLAVKQLIHWEWRFRLTDSGRATAEALEPLVELLDQNDGVKRVYILAALGDCDAAVKEAHRSGIHTDSLSQAATLQREQRIAVLKAALQGRDESHAGLALASLASFGKECGFSRTKEALQRLPVTALNHKALAAMSRWSGDDVIQCLAETLSRVSAVSMGGRVKSWLGMSATVDANEERPRLGLVVGISRRLFQMVGPSEMPAAMRAALRNALSSDCKACDEAAGFLLYLLDQHAGRAKLEANLSNPVPITRTGAACFLALIGDEWCIETLVRTANGPTDCGGHEAACALSLLDNDKAQSAASQWLRRNDGFEDAEGKEIELGGKKVRTWSMDEVMRLNLREHMRYDYERTLEKFQPLLKRWSENTGSSKNS